MLTSLFPRRVGQNWIIDVTEEMAQVIGLPLGSFILLHGKDGEIHADVLPPLSPELKQIADEVFQENLAVFQELKRLGD